MSKKLLPALGVAAALVATMATGSGASASSSGGSSKSVGVVSGPAGLSAEARALSSDSDRALDLYWTAARMQSAKPANIVRSGAPTKSAAPAQRGAAGAIPGTGDMTEVRDSALRMPGTYPLWGPRQATARTIGKVFFTDPRNGGSYVCSANVVNSEGKASVWTAGHCVAAGQTWMTNWIFVPAYKNGLAPWGKWFAYQPYTLTDWFYNENYSNDMAAVIMKRRGGVRIVDKLGGQGLKWNRGDLPRVVALGYPYAAPFNGQRLYRVNGQVNLDPFNGQVDRYMANNMTGGSSGGEWLREFNGQWGYINGHNDYRYKGYPQYMWSPYYGNNVDILYSYIRNLTV